MGRHQMRAHPTMVPGGPGSLVWQEIRNGVLCPWSCSWGKTAWRGELSSPQAKLMVERDQGDGSFQA